ncbi:bifunctional 4-hydroxy-2-oxoglutarate aldolase/2-dehydro-3-deoxy-phosphogluconate aldolase [Sneathiella aquimaris]|uniref:bifunctional 4-hydroxy-2-oxoglutarate aldolase/2-dehydro-3-deoxy-phosphogluconate aldolase n=1 Tax=Sneathiella aquimaris TaxID=2599305 RepID=UPI00146B0556|nr:bifunctional 4-hydroxy-2-oxoglutarate aldolase/2-dehydro-3-deoxy-phosphogluconate aldolase [Sneathiella aquimaris]
MRTQVSKLIGAAKVIPVLVIDDLDTAVPLAHCLVENGLPVLEITLRTQTALGAIERICNEVEGAIVGAGTILGADDLAAARKAGAVFGVSPGMTHELLDSLKQSDLPFLPGAATASEVMALRDAGFKEQKLFPAEVVGGTSFIKSVGGPVQDVSFCPTGGIRYDNMEQYLTLPNVMAIGGTWIAPKELLLRKEWETIGSLAFEASIKAASFAG